MIVLIKLNRCRTKRYWSAWILTHAALEFIVNCLEKVCSNPFHFDFDPHPRFLSPILKSLNVLIRKIKHEEDSSKKCLTPLRKNVYTGKLANQTQNGEFVYNNEMFLVEVIPYEKGATFLWYLEELVGTLTLILRQNQLNGMC